MVGEFWDLLCWGFFWFVWVFGRGGLCDWKAPIPGRSIKLSRENGEGAGSGCWLGLKVWLMEVF